MTPPDHRPVGEDEAKSFYAARLGFEVDTDVDLGEMRWLTVRLPADRDRVVLVQRIGDRYPGNGRCSAS